MAQITSTAGSTAVNLLKGALAGAVGVWALDRVTWFMYDREEPKALKREQKARPNGMDPAHVMVEKMASMFGADYEVRQPSSAGIAAHVALGVLPGALYGAYRGKGGMSLKRAAALGLGLFIVHDEIFNWTFGFSGAPTDYPWQAHARGAAGHLAFGAATEGTLAAMDHIAAKRKQKSGRTNEQSQRVSNAISPTVEHGIERRR